MDVVKVVRPRTLGDLIAFEVDPNFCRESGVLLAGSGSARTVPQFAVVGALGAAAKTATMTAKGTNTGNGTTASVSADAGAPEGDYKVVFIEPGANVGTFEVVRPDGSVDGEGVVAVAYNGLVNFTINDGATDFISGDEFTVHVAFGQGSIKYAQLDTTGVDGRQYASGLALFDATAPNGTDATVQVLARGPAIVRAEEVVWPGGITTDQKNQATAQLAALGILLRTSG